MQKQWHAFEAFFLQTQPWKATLVSFKCVCSSLCASVSCCSWKRIAVENLSDASDAVAIIATLRKHAWKFCERDRLPYCCFLGSAYTKSPLAECDCLPCLHGAKFMHRGPSDVIDVFSHAPDDNELQNAACDFIAVFQMKILAAGPTSHGQRCGRWRGVSRHRQGPATVENANTTCTAE